MIEAKCSTCGGPGMATNGIAIYFGQHTNPAVCRDHLKRKVAKLEKQLKEKDAALAAAVSNQASNS